MTKQLSKFASKGAFMALVNLGLIKQSASVTSTLIPKMSNPTGAQKYMSMLDGLHTPQAQHSLASRVNTSNPALMHASLLGAPSPTESLASRQFRTQMIDEALPYMQSNPAMRNELIAGSDTILPPRAMRRAM